MNHPAASLASFFALRPYNDHTPATLNGGASLPYDFNPVLR